MYQAPNEEQILFRQGRALLKEAQAPAKQISQSFSGLQNVLARLDAKNGDILDKQIGEDEAPYTDAKRSAYSDLRIVQQFFTQWTALKSALAGLEAPEVQALIAAMVTLCTPPPQEPNPEPEPEQEPGP